ncbi:MAG TPA: N(4)-(beta-N-acetylglucosaminyl)-L-asparaginase [Caulifigura sp.]|jgi:N4-(beta-N-acetylglucosaminyl)-L-asparaginase|nr:N(4)-(beta-N-acetylglucosaminyl)-L-asparaginase [Caulifigura sp.]
MLAIASANGLEAVGVCIQALSRGADPLDAVIAGIQNVEDDPGELTVGYGGLPNEEGIVELDAAVMHGPTHRAGAVASVRNIRHVSRLAKLVMQQTNHVLLAGAGAHRFARANGFQDENLLTERARKIWLYWMRTRSSIDDWIAPPLADADPEVREFFGLRDDHNPPAPGDFARSEADIEPAAGQRPTGTIHCSAQGPGGDISCCTSTSGLAFKIPGRVGDSPVVGAGLYVDNEVGSCGSTGRGECNLQHSTSAVAVELMRQGRTPAEAGLEMLRRIVKHTTQPHLLRPDGRPNFGLKLYLLRKDGLHAGVSLWGPSVYAIADETGARHEPCEFLFNRR